MPQKFTGKRSYQILSGELAAAQGREFERRVLPLLRILWTTAVGVPARLSLDRRGVDHLVWSDEPPFPLVVQCKGFQVGDDEMGRSQISQCVASIRSFQRSGLKAETYLLIHNRSGRNAGFRLAVQKELRSLIDSQQVARAKLWDRRTLLQAVGERLLDRLRASLAVDEKTSREFMLEQQICEPVERVPVQTRYLELDQYRLRAVSLARHSIADPSVEIAGVLDQENPNTLVVIAEAGYGKTTAVLRTFASAKRRIFYVPAAAISRRVVSTNDLLQELLKPDRVLPASDDALDSRVASLLTKPIPTYLLKDPSTPVALVIDGLDESIYLSRRGGLQSLFNQLREVRVPVVLTVRSEFWYARQADFALSFGEPGTETHKKQRLGVMELHPWGREQIQLLVRRYLGVQRTPERKRHLTGLLEVIDSGAFEEFYGDIPRRPLFLRLLLETVAEHGLRVTGLAGLLHDWARIKILRDIRLPRRWGNLGRDPILSDRESPDETLRLAFQAMMSAARHMIGPLQE